MINKAANIDEIHLAKQKQRLKEIQNFFENKTINLDAIKSIAVSTIPIHNFKKRKTCMLLILILQIYSFD